MGCRNESWKGEFDGNLCMPCHRDLVEILDETYFSQARINIRDRAKEYLKASEHFKVDERFK